MYYVRCQNVRDALCATCAVETTEIHYVPCALCATSEIYYIDPPSSDSKVLLWESVNVQRPLHEVPAG